MTLGGTIGNRIMKLRVIEYNTHKDKINLFQAYVCFGVRLFLGLLSFLTINMNCENRSIHDFATASVIILLTKVH